MSSPTSHPNRPVQTDREYYAELWGNTPASGSRHSLMELKRRSGFIAALAALALGVQLILGAMTSPGQQPSIEIGPAVGVGHSRSFTPSSSDSADRPSSAPSADGQTAPQRRTSNAVGDFNAD